MKRHATFLAWTAAWVVSAAVLALVSYSTGDPDSRLYAGIAKELVHQPISTWIAPQWWGYWDTHGPFFEHPFGIFVLPALLGRLGYPDAQAAYAANGLYQVLSFVLIARLVALLADPSRARTVSWLVQLIPIAFVFRVRANHEYALLLGWLFAIYAAERARSRPSWTAGMLAGFVWVLLVKGVFALVVPLGCATWLFAHRAAHDGGRARAAWIAIAAMPVVAVVVAAAYDLAYVQVTGRSFVRAYLGRQVPLGAMAGGISVARIGYNLAWYVARLLWYAFPWSVAAATLVVAWSRGWRLLARAQDRTDQAVCFAMLTTLSMVLMFALAYRKADRYLFPAYFVVAAAGATAVLERAPRVRALLQRIDSAVTPAIVWLLLLLLRVVTMGRLPEFTFWRT